MDLFWAFNLSFVIDILAFLGLETLLFEKLGDFSALGSGDIRLSINYSVSNETKRDEYWPNTEDFRLLNYSFNTGNIRSMIGQIVTEFYRIFQHLNE